MWLWHMDTEEGESSEDTFLWAGGKYLYINWAIQLLTGPHRKSFQKISDWFLSKAKITHDKMTKQGNVQDRLKAKQSSSEGTEAYLLTDDLCRLLSDEERVKSAP